MATIGIDDNKLKVLGCFKKILNYDEYYKFSFNLISRVYESNEDFRTKLKQTRKSNSYQAGLMVKKILKKMMLLKLSKSFFKRLLRFKGK
jgi:hypothetical protein